MKLFFTLFFLSLFYSAESLLPFYSFKKRGIHAVRNLSLGLLNGMIASVILSFFLLNAMYYSYKYSIGIFWNLEFHPAVEFLFAFILFDLWMYVWHVMIHKIGFLWRFHRTHHSDIQMDSTSALRFHTGEIIMSAMARLLVVPLIGMDLKQLVIYEIVLQGVIIFHHSNVNISESWDRILRVIIVTPGIHRVHHSDIQEETDSNYGSVFSFWDRIFKSFKLRRDPREIRLGLKEFREDEWQSFSGLMKTPFI